MNCGNFNILAIIAIPLGWLMWLCHLAIPVYALSLLLFTILTRLLLFPLSLKQHKGTAQMTAIKPKLDALQQKFGTNKEKLQQEQMKLYEEVHYNPLSGCLPTILQMVFLFGLISVIYNPLAHIVRLPDATITALKDKAAIVETAAGVDAGRLATIKNYDVYVISAVGRADKLVAEGKLASNPFAEYDDVVTAEDVGKIANLNMDIFGMFLGDTVDMPWPSQVQLYDAKGNARSYADGKPVTGSTGWRWSWMLLLPLISGLTALGSSIISMKMNPAQQSSGGGMKAMMYIMPVFSVWIAFTVPSGVVIYWVYSNILMIAQTFLLYKFWNPQKLADKLIAEQAEKEKLRKRRPARAEARIADGGKPLPAAYVDDRTPDQKELDRQRLAEARRRDAEKYGETYVDVTEDDLK